MGCAFDHRQTASNLAHRCQKRQAAMIIGDRFIGNRGTAGISQTIGLWGISRQMQIGEQDLIG
jgi:hypothetical protein